MTLTCELVGLPSRSAPVIDDGDVLLAEVPVAQTTPLPLRSVLPLNVYPRRSSRRTLTSSKLRGHSPSVGAAEAGVLPKTGVVATTSVPMSAPTTTLPPMHSLPSDEHRSI